MPSIVSLPGDHFQLFIQCLIYKPFVPWFLSIPRNSVNEKQLGEFVSSPGKNNEVGALPVTVGGEGKL